MTTGTYDRRAADKKYREANKDKVSAYLAAYKAAYTEEKKEQIRAQQAEYRAANKEKIKAKDKAYHARPEVKAAIAERAEKKRLAKAQDAADGELGQKQKACAVQGIRAAVFKKIDAIFCDLPDRFAPSTVSRLSGVSYTNPMLNVVLSQSFKCIQTASGEWKKPC